MSDAPTPSAMPLPRWVGLAAVGLLAGQLGLLWLQGLQLNRQHHDLVALRGDLQELAESLDQGAGSQGPESDGYAPSIDHGRRARYAPVRQEPPKPEGEQDNAAKELEASRDSARKGVADARKLQSQLSLEENAKKAAEKAKIKEARAAWEMWALGAIALIIGALLLRGWLRAREE